MEVTVRRLDEEKTSDEARWRILGLICTGVVLCMTTWFSATAIMPELVQAWGLSTTQVAWLTNAVQLGFVTGALLSSFVSLPDLAPLRLLMGLSALVAALANLGLLWAPAAESLLASRFVTGMALAGVYPPALKLISTWFVRGRGLALGCVIAALTLGSSSPHLVRFLSGSIDWRAVVLTASVCTVLGAGILLLFAKEGPFPFSRWGPSGTIVRLCWQTLGTSAICGSCKRCGDGFLPSPELHRRISDW